MKKSGVTRKRSGKAVRQDDKVGEKQEGTRWGQEAKGRGLHICTSSQIAKGQREGTTQGLKSRQHLINVCPGGKAGRRKGFLSLGLFKDFVSRADLPAEKMDREPLKTSDHANTQFIKEETCWCYGVFLAKVSAVCEVTTVRL